MLILIFFFFWFMIYEIKDQAAKCDKVVPNKEHSTVNGRFRGLESLQGKVIHSHLPQATHSLRISTPHKEVLLIFGNISNWWLIMYQEKEMSLMWLTIAIILYSKCSNNLYVCVCVGGWTLGWISGEWWNADTETIINQALQIGGAPNISDAYTINGLSRPFYNYSDKGITIVTIAHVQRIIGDDYL